VTVTFCQSGIWIIFSLVVSGMVSSLEELPGMLVWKVNVPTASSSDVCVRPQMVTLPVSPTRSESAWFTKTNVTVMPLDDLPKRTPVTSTYFCNGLVLPPDLAAGLSTVAAGLVALWLLLPVTIQ
jgi:hypothetical protein